MDVTVPLFKPEGLRPDENPVGEYSLRVIINPYNIKIIPVAPRESRTQKATITATNQNPEITRCTP